MGELEVRIVKLDHMRVASAYGFGQSPEGQAWENLIAWAKPKGLLQDPEKYRIFGFNNPDPAPGSPNYGYEFWITVGPDVEPEGEIRVQDFGGGLYAVTRCQGVSTIGETLKKLGTWVEDSQYRWARHQWLEEHIGPADAPQDEEALVVDLFFPIAE